MNRIKIVGVLVAVALVAVAVATPVQAASLTSAQVSAIVSLLQSFGADASTVASVQGTLSGTSVSAPVVTVSSMFTMDLGVGSRGAEVTALQNKLGVAPATGYFGPLTKAAVQQYQASKGISATGFVGPLTRAALNAGVTTTTTTTTTTTSTTGVEGTLSVTASNAGLPSTIYEGDSMVGVLGFKIEAKNSDVTVQRVKVSLGTNTYAYNKIYDRIYVTDGSNVLASSDLNSSTVVKESDGTYTITLTGMNVVVPKDGSKVLTVKVDVKGSVDSTYRTAHAVAFALYGTSNDGIRGVDGAGINQYAGSNAITRTISTISAVLTESATLTVSKYSTSPVASEAVAASGSSENEYDKLTVLVMEVKAEKDNVTINDLPVVIAKTASSATTATATTAYLFDGSTEIANAAIDAQTGYAKFTDIDLTVNKDSSRILTVKVDIRTADSVATTFTASATSSSAFDAENGAGDDVNPSGSATGEGITVRNVGPEFTLVSKSLTTSAGTFDGATSTARAEFVVKVKAVGGTVTLGTAATGTPAFGTSTTYFKVYKDGVALAGSSLKVASSTSLLEPSGLTTVTGGFQIAEGNSAELLVSFTFDGRDASYALITGGDYSVNLAGIKWSVDNGATFDTSSFMSGNSSWRTSGKTMPI